MYLVCITMPQKWIFRLELSKIQKPFKCSQSNCLLLIFQLLESTRLYHWKHADAENSLLWKFDNSYTDPDYTSCPLFRNKPAVQKLNSKIQINGQAVCWRIIHEHAGGNLTYNFKSLENLSMLYIVRKVLASLVEFSNIYDVLSCIAHLHIFCSRKG